MQTLIEPHHPDLTITEQCELLGLARSSYYYVPSPETPENLHLMRILDETHMKWPWYGTRNHLLHLQDQGYPVNRKRIQRLMRMMEMHAIYPKPKTSQRAPEYKKYPYLLRNMAVTKPNQVWCADITYIPMAKGFMYLMAVMDWYSRFVLSWTISNSMESSFCLDGLNEAIRVYHKPQIFNTDQGAQFTSLGFTSRLESAQIAVSMDGKGRALDNAFIERLWRSVKYEKIYLNSYQDGRSLFLGLREWFQYYNYERVHQGLDGMKPIQAYQS